MSPEGSAPPEAPQDEPPAPPQDREPDPREPEPPQDREPARERASYPSASGVPGARVAPKKPRYLLVALIMALLFGAGCWTEGCARLAFYRGEPDQAQSLNSAIRSDTDRAKVEGLYQRFTEVADASRGRTIPAAAAVFVLGAALLVLAARGLAGKTNTRSALVQVVTAQAIVVVVAYLFTRDFRNAELDWDMARQLAGQRETVPPEQYEQVVTMMTAMRSVMVPGWLVLRTFASALIVVALTRQRSREFFEAAGNAAAER